MSFGKLLAAYVALLTLLAAEFFASFLRLGATARLLLLLPAALMAAVVATRFMELRREGPVPLLFATSGVVWLAILLALGGVDPLTRAMYLAPDSAASSALKAPLSR